MSQTLRCDVPAPRPRPPSDPRHHHGCLQPAGLVDQGRSVSQPPLTDPHTSNGATWRPDPAGASRLHRQPLWTARARAIRLNRQLGGDFKTGATPQGAEFVPHRGPLHLGRCPRCPDTSNPPRCPRWCELSHPHPLQATGTVRVNHRRACRGARRAYTVPS